MGEPEEAVGDEVEVEELVGKASGAAQQDDGGEGQEVEEDLDRYGRPAGDAVRAAGGKRAEVAGDPLAAAVRQAADPADQDADGSDQGELVAGDLGVSDEALGELDAEEATEQGAGDGLAGEEVQPALVTGGDEPAFGGEVGELGPEEGAAESRRINEREQRVVLGVPYPIDRADDDGQEEEEAVGGWGE